ncbi:hypothetical protein BG000_008974, partial [Podila horticola]
GAQALAEALKINLTLTTLNFWNNSIGDNGARALAKALKTNSTLTTLNLAGNSIGDIGALELSEALRTNSTLTTLELQNNPIGDGGARLLRQVSQAITSPTTSTHKSGPVTPILGTPSSFVQQDSPPPPARLEFRLEMGNIIGTVQDEAFSKAMNLITSHMQAIFEDQDYPGKDVMMCQDPEYIFSDLYRADQRAKNLCKLKVLFYACKETEEKDQANVETGESSKSVGDGVQGVQHEPGEPSQPFDTKSTENL